MDAANIDWQALDELGANGLRVGDLVSADAGGMPIYQVVSLVGGTARLRDVQSGGDRIMPLGALHWRAGV